MAKVKIVNLVATASLGQRLDLDDLGKFDEVLHDPEIYGGRVAYFKSSDMEGKVSIFPSGKLISIGTRSETGAFKELNQAKRFLVRKGFIKSVPMKVTVQNIVAKVDFGVPINIEELGLKSDVIYEPEQFPAGILRVREPTKATVLLFASGQAIVAGLKSSEQIEPLIQKLTVIITKNESDQ